LKPNCSFTILITGTNVKSDVLFEADVHYPNGMVLPISGKWEGVDVKSVGYKIQEHPNLPSSK